MDGERYLVGQSEPPNDEFYTLPLPRGLVRLQAELDAYLAYYNHRRPHMALEGLAPLEFLAKMQAESVPQSQIPSCAT